MSYFPTTSPITRHHAGTPIIENDAQLTSLVVKKKAITLEALAKLDTLNGKQPVLKFDQLECDKVYMLKEYSVLETGERFTCIGVLESGEEFWMPKSLYNKVNVEPPPHAFVYKGRGGGQCRPYITNVYLNSILKANGLL